MIAITGGKILTMDEAGTIDNGVILVEGAFIKSVGKNEPPENMSYLVLLMPIPI